MQIDEGANKKSDFLDFGTKKPPNLLTVYHRCDLGHHHIFEAKDCIVIERVTLF